LDSFPQNKGGILAEATQKHKNRSRRQEQEQEVGRRIPAAPAYCAPAYLRDSLQPFDIQDARDPLYRSDYAVEVLYVEDFHSHFDVAALVGRD
jgi:hypothetical protein